MANLAVVVQNAREQGQWEVAANILDTNVYVALTHLGVPHRQVLQLLARRVYDQGIAKILSLVSTVRLIAFCEGCVVCCFGLVIWWV